MKIRRFKLSLLFLCLASTLWAQEPEITFQIDTSSIFIGESAILKWDIQNAQNVYMSNVGKIPSTGSKTISPENNTVYTIFAESTHNITIKSIFLEVYGPRNVYPSEQKFEVQRLYSITSLSFIDLLETIHNVLQNHLGFQVNETYDRHSKETTFLTKLSQKDELVKPNESEIRTRKISYLIKVNEIPSRSNEFSFSINAYIEYQLRSEDRYRHEHDENIYTYEIQKLHELISNVLNQL